MEKESILPQLSAQDIQQVIDIIQRANASGSLSSEDQKRLQNDLLEIQRRNEAWGLIIPLLNHSDPNVQFFGAHTAQSKTVRDWDSIPIDKRVDFKDLILALTGHAVLSRKHKVVLTKLFVVLNTLALKLAVGHPPPWPNWIEDCVKTLTSSGADTALTMEFLTIVAEEVTSADLLRESKMQMEQTLQAFSSKLVQQVVASTARSDVPESELVSSLKCLEAWIGWGLPADQLTPMIPLMINLISQQNTFVPASELLQTLLTESSLADGAGVKTVTIPLFNWAQQHGQTIFQASVVEGVADEMGHSFCKLIVSIADHSTPYITKHLSDAPVQTLLNLLLAFTSLPGYYGVDEEESELTLSFWYRLQEEIWNTDYNLREETPFLEDDLNDQSDLFAVAAVAAGKSSSRPLTHEGEMLWKLSQNVYRELIKRLRVKVMWPPPGTLQGWMKDQKDKFVVYRRDVGDTLINAYYVLRDELLQYFVDDLFVQLATRRPEDPWEAVEAILHCILSVQEAVPILDNPYLSRLFSEEVLLRLPAQGNSPTRLTMLSLIAAYSTWFPSQEVSRLMIVITYVVNALGEPALCHSAANALRDLCDANRTKLTPHIAAFGQLYSNIGNIPDSEKAKVVQSIASVIEALPPAEGVDPIHAIITPIVARAFEAMSMASQLPEEARTLCIYQVEAITACARGLTKNADTMFILDEPSPQETEVMNSARSDERMVKVREQIMEMLQRSLEVWLKDALIYDAISELLRAITSLPGDTTLLTLTPGPLLQLVVRVAEKDLNAIWLSQAGRLILQLNPPTFSSLKPTPSFDSLKLLNHLVPVLIRSALNLLASHGGMIGNPDIVKALFESMTTLSEHFLSVFFEIPSDIFQGLVECAISALLLEERYSLVKSCSFLNSLCNKLLMNPEMESQALALTDAFGYKMLRAVILGIAGGSPRSVIPNLTDLLSNIVSKRREQAKLWLEDILFKNELLNGKAGEPDKKKFLDSIIASRSTRKTKDAVQQFAIISRGLEGSSFGYSTLTAI